MDRTSAGDPNLALADARRDEAVLARRAERVERMILAEEVTFAGVLADAVGRGDDVVIEMSTGRRHGGYLSGVGTDFVLVQPPGSAPIALRTSRVVALRRRERGTRGQSTDAVTDLAEVMTELAAVEASVQLVLDGGSVVSGTLREAGPDVVVVSVRPEGDVAYLVLAAVNEVSSMSMTSSS